MVWPLRAVALVLAFGGAIAYAAEADVDPRGPVENPGMNVLVDPTGVQAPAYTFDNQTAQPSPWQAKWIWLAREKPGMVAGCFRKEVTLEDAPKQVSAWISADIKYRLYVNGKLASRGPADIGTDYAGGSTGRWFYDARDLTPLFHKGKNVVAAEVFKQWFIGHAVSRGHNGLLFEADVTTADGKSTTIKTDPTWRGVPSDYLLVGDPRPAKGSKPRDGLVYDANKEPAGWRLPGFDDSAWPACVAAGEHWDQFVPSEIPPLMEARFPLKDVERVTGGVKVPDQPFENGNPIVCTADGGFAVVFDRVLSAYPTVKVKGGRGALLTIESNERNAPGATRRASMILGDGVQYFEFPFIDGLTAINFTLTNVTSPVEIQDAGAVFTSQPVAYKGSFACGDLGLDRLWAVSRWVVQINLQTYHLDSPNHQEPISDPGDYVIESMVNHYAFAQPWLARQDLRKFAWLLKDEKYRNFHTSYSLAWLRMLLDDYDYTGDKALVTELAPVVHELLDTYASWRGKNGLISEAPNYMFMDWVNIGGFGCHHPPAVIGQGYLTALYYGGLADGARVAELAGDAARVAKYDALRADVAAAFERELWVPQKGLYRDGKPFQTTVKPYNWLPADKDVQTFSPHVNVLAVLYDLAPKDRRPAIIDKVLADRQPNVQPWFMHWVFAAIAHAGLFDKYGTAQLRRWRVIDETQSFREMWSTGDYSHGWCSTPLVQMSQRILGVAPASPGFDTIAIRPTLCDLSWARGVVPTPHGNVEVAWSKEETGLRLDVTVPDGAEADVAIPVGGGPPPPVTANGKPIWGPKGATGSVTGVSPAKLSGSAVEVHVAAGKYAFSVQQPPVPASASAP